MSDGAIAEDLYREAIARLARCRLALELARAHLLYGEWLRRARRRLDAREQLRPRARDVHRHARQAFADRAARELQATGETARKRTAGPRTTSRPTRPDRADGTRRGIQPGDRHQLFVSRKTIEYHLHKVFIKLGISTREHLDRALPAA